MEQKIIKQVAKEFNLPQGLIKEIYKDWLLYIKEYIANEDFSEYKQQLGFVFPYLGKAILNEYKVKEINNVKNGRTKRRIESEKDTSQE